MKWMSVNELREQFLSFFESLNHLRLESFPLIPKDDSSLLIINSGMAPMKKWFLGLETPPQKRVTTSQKCIRTPDIERVGKTSRHGTFFEMLGNFSFGDYFKKDAISWAWKFLTEVLEIPKDKLYITVFTDDDEAYDIWLNQIKVDKKRLSHLGKDDNFWEIGTGPCGPCSEIYFDRGQDKGCNNPNCAPGCDCDRFVEIWNLVFSQYCSDGKGNYPPMEHPNIDTGMGLERLACVIQNVDNLFLIDSMQKIIEKISKISGVEYGDNKKTDVAIRIITDHIRSIVFMTADGIIPSNEGRGYVLRRLIRRAFRNGKLLGISKPFLFKLLKTVIEENASSYPYLKERENYIERIVKAEEESFDKILDRGMEYLSQAIDKLDSRIGELSGEDAFLLCDTYGFPFEIIKDIIIEKNLKVDEKTFIELMKKQKETARNAQTANSVGWSGENLTLPNQNPTEFLGYNSYECEATLLYIYTKEGEKKSVKTDEDCIFIFDRTPYYAESGGQVGDKGTVSYQNNVANIYDCKKLSSGQFIHKAKILSGEFIKGINVSLSINVKRRLSISRNHTAAHLLQKALQIVLGNHVHQAGQLVDESRIRFDFNHFKGMNQNEINEVEKIVNHQILNGIPTEISLTDKETAKKKGAMALFGEKYGEIVRVVDIGEASIELCGGTHVDNTSKIGLFQIISEGSASAGIRRITATTGTGVLNYIYELKKCIYETCVPLKIDNYNELPKKAKSLTTEIKSLNKVIESLNSKLAGNKLEGVLEDKIKQIEGFKVISVSFSGIDKTALREMGDKVKANTPDVIACFASLDEEKATLLVVCGEEALKKGADAGFIIKELALIAGGNGGGKKSSAMAGIKNPFKLDEAFAKLPEIIEKMNI